MSIYRKVKRQGAQKPPLSLIDKTIYSTLVIIGILSVFLMLIYMETAEAIGVAEENVIACSGYASVLWSLPLTLTLTFSLSLPAGIALKNKQPIFGNKKFKPHPFESTIKTYPLFSREFWESLSDKTKRKTKITVTSIAILLAFCLAISFLGIYPRNVLRADGSIASYDFQNQLKDEYNVQEVEQLKISIHRRTKRSFQYNVSLEFVINNKSFSFLEGSFSGTSSSERSSTEIFEMMLHIKELVGAEKCVYDSKRLEDMIYYEDLTPEEERLVRKLFEP